MQVVILKNPPKHAFFDIFSKLKKGTISQSKFYEAISCTKVEIPKTKLKTHVDGEPVFFKDGIELNVNPKSLKILVPSVD